jgi:S-(hydroxymethyl)glutathione dehydrogenase/alcohol dehydrogenase
MQTLAAILVETNQPLVIDTLEIPSLKQGQVLVEVHYSGICHTQLLEARGHRGKDAFLPHCLGHEGSGVVVEVGQGVTKVRPGDHVILSWIKGTGANVPGTTYDWKGKKVNAGAITTFSEYSVISENRLTPIAKEVPLKEAALFGCMVPTGFGTVFNTARPEPGQSLAVFGCGGIGLCAIQAASIAGCAPIIAIDINPEKLKTARNVGATHLIDASKENAVEAIQKIGSLDFAIEASGSPIAMEQALRSVRQQGGCAVVIGNAKHGQHLSFDPKELNLGKRLLGTWGGDNTPDTHYPRYLNLMTHGLLDLSHFLAKTYELSNINSALDDLEKGLAVRPIVEFHAHRS